MCSGRTTVLSVEAPGLMKHLSVPGTRTDTWPNIPIVPWKLRIRVSVAAFSRSTASSFMSRIPPSARKGLMTPPRLFGPRQACALNQTAPAIDLRRQEFLQLGRRSAVHRDGADPDHHIANLGHYGDRLELGVQPINHRFGRC